MNHEVTRLAEADERNVPLRKWESCISARQSGAFRLEFSRDGSAWDYFTHGQARSVLNLCQYYGDEFKVECPTGSGKLKTLFEVHHELSDRLDRTGCQVDSTVPHDDRRQGRRNISLGWRAEFRAPAAAGRGGR